MTPKNHYTTIVCEKIKANFKREKHPRGGWIGYLKILFKHNKFKHKINKYKETMLEKSNSNFIVVQHFLGYVHSPQAPNWVRIPLTWSFNQASNHLYTWISAPMDSYIISTSFNSLEGFNTQLTSMKLST